MARFDLWPRPFRLAHVGGKPVRFRDDVRECVAFIGVGVGAGFESLGTAFFIGWGGARYLVTARHVADGLEDLPFAVRVNKNGPAGVVDVTYDPAEHGKDWPWLVHDDPTVDAALMDFNINWRMPDVDADAKSIPQEMFLRTDQFDDRNAGVGDFCYVVGLFRLMRGKTRNLPFVHSGNIGLLPSDERIPVRNWRKEPGAPKTIHVEGYLVEMTSLGGLSGSPVFVRPTFDFVDLPLNTGEKVTARLPQADVYVMGVWQSAWDGDPDDTLRAEVGNYKVPVRIGAVVPVQRIIEILEGPVATERRNAFIARKDAARAANPD